MVLFKNKPKKISKLKRESEDSLTIQGRKITFKIDAILVPFISKI